MLESSNEKNTRYKNIQQIFFKHKYLTNPAVTPADATLAAASNLASQLRKHHTRHLGRKQPHKLTNLNTIFADAAATNAADAPLLPDTQPADCCVAVAARRHKMRRGPKKMQLSSHTSDGVMPSPQPHLQG